MTLDEGPLLDDVFPLTLLAIRPCSSEHGSGSAPVPSGVIQEQFNHTCMDDPMVGGHHLPLAKHTSTPPAARMNGGALHHLSSSTALQCSVTQVGANEQLLGSRRIALFGHLATREAFKMTKICNL